ncbi:unnamed protein product [Meloidogyne enterolobii]|uniref:Uncharacterized protein n=1 Tax=Meloidogyne enterolobii TaxID=390850 RepID=A0ACB0Y5S5_MELEN
MFLQARLCLLLKLHLPRLRINPECSMRVERVKYEPYQFPIAANKKSTVRRFRDLLRDCCTFQSKEGHVRRFCCPGKQQSKRRRTSKARGRRPQKMPNGRQPATTLQQADLGLRQCNH